MPNFELSVYVPENPDQKNIVNVTETTEPIKRFRCSIKGDLSCHYRCVAAFESLQAAKDHWAPLLQAFETEPSHVE